MNQHNQMMREALLAAEELAEEASGNGNNWNEWCLPRLKKIQEALAHVNETPKNEHDSADVLKPAKLVRLTEEEIADEYSKADSYLMLCDEYEFGLVANAIMYAMIEKNGGDE